MALENGQFEVYFRNDGVQGGDWIGFPLAYRDRGGYAGVERPLHAWWPWSLDPAHPDEPEFGRRWNKEWDLYILLAEGLLGLDGLPMWDDKGLVRFNVKSWYGWLKDLMDRGACTMRDPDANMWAVMMTEYEEWTLNYKDAQTGDLDYLIRLRVVQTSPG